MQLNRTVKPKIPFYSAFLDIETTHSTCEFWVILKLGTEIQKNH